MGLTAALISDPLDPVRWTEGADIVPEITQEWLRAFEPDAGHFPATEARVNRVLQAYVDRGAGSARGDLVDRVLRKHLARGGELDTTALSQELAERFIAHQYGFAWTGRLAPEDMQALVAEARTRLKGLGDPGPDAP